MNLIPWILQTSRLFLAVTLLAGPACPVYAGFESAPPTYKDGAAVQSDSAKKTVQSPAGLKIPMYFEANHGQLDASVKFFTRAAGYNLYLTGPQAVMVMAKTAAKGTEPGVVRMKLKGANAKPSVRGLNMLPGSTSYFFGGDRSKWRTGVKQYGKVRFAQIYPGIDMVYRFDKGNVEYDFVVAPGANPGRILIGFEGGKGLRLDTKGNLVLRTEGGELTYKAPQLYQKLGARRVPVPGRFVLAANRNVRFEVGNYIKSKELIIDPEIVYSTFLGGDADDRITAIAVDGTKQAYVTGWSNSLMTGDIVPCGFPAPTTALAAPGPAEQGGRDVFVAKLSADGTALIWLAWLGGDLDDQANSIALDTSDVSVPKVYITGTTKSSSAGTPFPFLQPGAALQSCNTNAAPGSLAFVTELQQPGNSPALVYSTCWGHTGGTSVTVGNSIAVGPDGAAYVTGTTEANAPLFPIIGPVSTVAPYGSRGAAAEAGFVVKIAPAGASVAYSMFLGPQADITRSHTISVDSLGQAWVAGMTTSTGFNTNALGHFLSSYAGTSSVFVAQVNTAGTGLLYATYINGNSEQEATAIALNHGGAAPYHVFVAGWTLSTTGFPSDDYYNLPVAVRPVVYQKGPVGSYDPFIVRLNPLAARPIPDTYANGDNPLEMQYATRLGATGEDRAYALALDSNDDAYIAGWTLSSDWVISTTPPDPVTACTSPCVSLNATPGKLMGNTAGGKLAFMAAIGPTGQFQPFFSYLGATDPGTEATGIVIDAEHGIYVAGFTPNADFPLVTGSLMDGSVPLKQINRTGTAVVATDGFVTKIAPVLSFGPPGFPPTTGCTILGVNPGLGFALGGSTVTITGTGFINFSGPSGVTFDGINAANYTVVTNTLITAVTPAHPIGSVPLTITTTAGTCSTTYKYVAASVCGGEDYFFPSPATGVTANFSYCMAHDGTAKIRIYNVIGDLVAKLEDAKSAGAQLSPLNTARLAPGVYLYRLEKNYGGGNSTTSTVKKFVVKH